MLKQIYDEKLPLMKIQRTAPPPPPLKKIEIPLSQLLINRDIHNLPPYISFEDDKKDEIF